MVQCFILVGRSVFRVSNDCWWFSNIVFHYQRPLIPLATATCWASSRTRPMPRRPSMSGTRSTSRWGSTGGWCQIHGDSQNIGGSLAPSPNPGWGRPHELHTMYSFLVPWLSLINLSWLVVELKLQKYYESSFKHRCSILSRWVTSEKLSKQFAFPRGLLGWLHGFTTLGAL